MNDNTYLDEFNQDEQIMHAVKDGCLRMTLLIIIVTFFVILISVFSCGHTKHKKSCEAYGNGKTYQKR